MNYFETDEFKLRSKTFSKRLAIALDIRGCSQKWLAEKANTTEATISRYMQSVNRPAFAVILCDIAKALNVSADFLVGLSDNPIMRETLNNNEMVLMKCFNQASDSDRMVIWTLLAKYMSDEERETVFYKG